MQKHMRSKAGRELCYVHLGLLKKWGCGAYGNHITVCQKPADRDGSQAWPLPAWLKLNERERGMKTRARLQRITC